MHSFEYNNRVSGISLHFLYQFILAHYFSFLVHYLIQTFWESIPKQGIHHTIEDGVSLAQSKTFTTFPSLRQPAFLEITPDTSWDLSPF